MILTLLIMMIELGPESFCIFFLHTNFPLEAKDNDGKTIIFSLINHPSVFVRDNDSDDENFQLQAIHKTYPSVVKQF